MKASDLIEEVEAHLHNLATLTEVAKTSPPVLDYLKFMGSFHRYSLHNTLSIWAHCPHASQVAGYKTWQRLGRFVKRGEKGIPILSPCTHKCTQANGDEIEEVYAFKVVYVFDVSQTEGKSLPEAPITPRGSGQDLLPILETIAHGLGITYEYKGLHGSHHGTSCGGRIVIDSRLDDAGKVSVFIHELAHEMLHREVKRKELPRKLKEIEAEAVSCVVCTHFNLATKAPNYLALWDVERDQVIGVFQAIHQVATDIVYQITACQVPA